MRFLNHLCVILFGAYCIAFDSLPTEEFLKFINSNQSVWIAGANFPESILEEDFAMFSGVLGIQPVSNIEIPVEIHETDQLNIPSSFNSDTKWPFCADHINNIRNQGRCGSSWALAATEVMSDRLCIQSLGEVKFEFSSEDVLSCCSYCGYGCGGGYTGEAFRFWVTSGIVSGGYYTDEGCKPYGCFSELLNDTPKECQEMCSNSKYRNAYESDKHFGKRYYQVNSSQQIQLEIMTKGPVVADFTVYQDFIQYQSGVYYHVLGDRVGRHAVKIVGWGEENEYPYWLVANSWGKNWGNLGGFFKIVRGRNECNIEQHVLAGDAAHDSGDGIFFKSENVRRKRDVTESFNSSSDANSITSNSTIMHTTAEVVAGSSSNNNTEQQITTLSYNDTTGTTTTNSTKNASSATSDSTSPLTTNLNTTVEITTGLSNHSTEQKTTTSSYKDTTDTTTTNSTNNPTSATGDSTSPLTTDLNTTVEITTGLSNNSTEQRTTTLSYNDTTGTTTTNSTKNASSATSNSISPLTTILNTTVEITTGLSNNSTEQRTTTLSYNDTTGTTTTNSTENASSATTNSISPLTTILNTTVEITTGLSNNSTEQQTTSSSYNDTTGTTTTNSTKNATTTRSNPTSPPTTAMNTTAETIGSFSNNSSEQQSATPSYVDPSDPTSTATSTSISSSSFKSSPVGLYLFICYFLLLPFRKPYTL